MGNIMVEPWDSSMVGPNSIDLHLGNTMLTYKRLGYRIPVIDPCDPKRVWVINSKSPPPTEEVPLHSLYKGWILVPGRLYLAATKEYTETRGFVPYVDGRSSMGRLGLFCHVTAGRGDNGFRGNWTLELVTVEPLVVYPGQRIAQLTYHSIEGDQTLYTGRYQDDKTPQGIKLLPLREVDEP
jgi:dCTP deaminase